MPSLGLALGKPFDKPFGDAFQKFLDSCGGLVSMYAEESDRPILQGAALSFDGATQYGVSQPLVTNGDTFINIKMWLKPNEPVNDRMFMSLMHSGSDDVRLITNGSQLIDLVLDDGSISTISTTESSTSNTWRYVEIYVADGENWIEFDGVRYSGTNSFNFATLTDGRLGIGARATGGFFANCLFLDLKLETDSVNEHWDLRDNGLSALTSGTDLTLVGSPVSVTDNTIPVDPANERGFSGRMLFDGVDNVGVSFTPITLTGDFRMSFEASSNTIHQGVLIGDSLNVTWIRAQENGVIVFKGSGGTKSTPAGTFLFDGVSRLFEFEKVGSDIFLKIDNILVYTYLLFTGSEEFSRIGNKANVDEFQGTIYNVNINDQASYLGTGNQASDWLDQIGSNNGTVTGGEYFAALALSDDPSTDVLGNPTQWQGSAYPVRPVERQSNALSFDGATQSMTVAALTGSETVVSSEGTSTPTISAGTIDFTSGTCSNLVLSNGFVFNIAEGAGSTAYSTDSTNHATLVGNPTWVREDGIPSSNLNDGFSKRMYFDGVDDKVRLGSPITLSGDFTISFEIMAEAVVKDIVKNLHILSDTTGSSRLGINTQSRLALTDTVDTHLYFTSFTPSIGDNYLVQISRTGTTASLTVDGVFIENVTSTGTYIFNAIAAIRGTATSWTTFKGLLYDVNINDQASYLGTGNQDGDWLDQIGSNNGSVTGGETLRIPAAEGSNSLDAVGGTLTNPAVSNGPHNDAETELDFYNIATDGGTTPAVLASGVVLTDYSFGDTLTNPMFKRTISAVAEDRHTLFSEVLSGACLGKANRFFTVNYWIDTDIWDDSEIWED